MTHPMDKPPEEWTVPDFVQMIRFLLALRVSRYVPRWLSRAVAGRYNLPKRTTNMKQR